MKLHIKKLHSEPLIHSKHKDCQDVRFGYEGGTVIRQNGTTYIFTTENYDAPKNCKVRMVCFKSTDGVNFERATVLAQHSGELYRKDSFVATWAPILIFNEEDNVWQCFYVYYTHKIDKDKESPWNFFGRIGVLKSSAKGRDGIEGPYNDHGLAPISDDPQGWEGLCGQVFFYPFQTEKGWLSFYGSNTIGLDLDASSNPQEGDGGFKFTTGLASSSSLNGPWQRLPEGNPVQLDPRFIENTIVKKLPSGTYSVLFDGGCQDAISYSHSKDGINWLKATRLKLPADKPAMLNEVRTSLGMVDNEDGTYDLYFTAYDGNNPDKTPPLWHDGFGCLWKAIVEIEE